MQIDVGGGHQLEEQSLPATATPQQADPESPTAVHHGHPVAPAVAQHLSGQKRKRTAAQTEQQEEQPIKAAQGDLTCAAPLSALPKSDLQQHDAGVTNQAGLAQPVTHAGRTSVSSEDISDIDEEDIDDAEEDGDDDDLLVVKRRDVLSSSNDAHDAAEGIPLGAVELRGLKKKKKLRIDPGRTSGARTVFDEEGESLQPLALLAKEQLDRWEDVCVCVCVLCQMCVCVPNVCVCHAKRAMPNVHVCHAKRAMPILHVRYAKRAMQIVHVCHAICACVRH